MIDTMTVKRPAPSSGNGPFSIRNPIQGVCRSNAWILFYPDWIRFLCRKCHRIRFQRLQNDFNGFFQLGIVTLDDIRRPLLYLDIRGNAFVFDLPAVLCEERQVG